jgi:AraC family transcriptional activator of tynA and feaB
MNGSPAEDMDAAAAAHLPGKRMRWLDFALSPSSRFVSRRLGPATVLQADFPPLSLSQPAACACPGERHLVVHLAGRGVYRHERGRTLQAAGDVVVLGGAPGCGVSHPDGGRVIRWTLPASRLDPFLPGAAAQDVLLLPGDRAVTRALAAWASALAGLRGPTAPAAADELITHLCALTGLAAREAAGARSAGLDRADRQRARLLFHIEQNIGDPELSPAAAARALGFSERWAHALMAPTGRSFREHLVARRIERSAIMLRDATMKDMPVARIAFQCGFNDLTTFYRRFRRRHGQAPGAWRRLPRNRAGS